MVRDSLLVAFLEEVRYEESRMISRSGLDRRIFNPAISGGAEAPNFHPSLIHWTIPLSPPKQKD